MAPLHLAMPLWPRAVRNLLAGPVTRRYPERAREPFPRARGQLLIDLSACTFCDLCARQCPAAALALDREGRTLSLEGLRCISCGVCVDLCSPKCLTLSPEAPRVLVQAEAGPQGTLPRGRRQAQQRLPASPPKAT